MTFVTFLGQAQGLRRRFAKDDRLYKGSRRIWGCSATQCKQLFWFGKAVGFAGGFVDDKRFVSLRCIGVPLIFH